VEVFKEASRLCRVSEVAANKDVVSYYLSIVAEEEANTVVGVAPFEKLVVWREIKAERRGT
jgi:hypothetical protein